MKKLIIIIMLILFSLLMVLLSDRLINAFDNIREGLNDTELLRIGARILSER